jgi:Spherulation-specific family 4/Kelch motif
MKLRTSTIAKLLMGALLGGLFCSASQPLSAAPEEICQQIAMPAYFYPGGLWTQALTGDPKGEWLTMNPASGPGLQRDPTYAATVKQAHTAGAKVLGYVHTSYAARPIADVQAEVTAYKTWYAVDGIFVDEVATNTASLSYYQNLATFIRTTPGRLVELNPGTVPDVGYFSVGDSVVVFEGDYQSYQTTTFPAWLSQQPPRKVAHLVYAAPDQTALTTTLQLAQARGAGRVFVTNDTLPNPWDTLPPYWAQEAAALATSCTTPSPLVLDVTTLGAQPNGSGDSTPAFQAARDQLTTAGGGELDIPAGTYLIRPDAVSFGSDTIIKGSGATLRGTADGYALFEVGGSDIQISGITLDAANRVVHGLEIDRATSRLIVSNTVVTNVSQSTDPTNPNFNQTPVGIRVQGDGAHLTFESVTISNVVAMNTGGADWPHKIARGMLLDNGGGAADVSHDVLVHASHFSNVAPKDDGDCLVAQGSISDIGLRIDGNSFDACHKRAIKLQVSGVVVRNNTINNPFLGNNVYDTYLETYINGHPSFDMFSAIGVFGSRVQILGNTIGGIGSYYNGIELDGSSALSGIVINNNRIANGPTAEIGAPESSIRSFVGLTAPVITNNALKHAQIGINLGLPPTSPTISGNTFTNVTTQITGASTPTPTATSTQTSTATATATGTASATPTVTNTATDTSTPTATATSTQTAAPTATATDTPTPTATTTYTPTPSATATTTDTPTPTATASPSPVTDLVWATAADLPTGRSGLAVAASGSFIDAAGGTSVAGDSAAFEQYDVIAGTWRRGANLPSPRRGLALVANNASIFALGGCQALRCTFFGDLLQYDQPTDSWSARANMLTPRERFGAALAANGSIYAVGGMAASGPVDVVEQYDPTRNMWSTVQHLPSARYGLAVVASPDGRVFAIGGAERNAAVATVDVYDPRFSAWTAVAPLNTPRAYLAAVATGNGRIFAIGGTTDLTNPLSSVEEYDPSTNSWTPRASMPTARYLLGAALGSDGQLYAVGGTTDFVTTLTTVEDASVP